jgi:sec-independent protein translocase protein TatA
MWRRGEDPADAESIRLGAAGNIPQSGRVISLAGAVLVVFANADRRRKTEMGFHWMEMIVIAGVALLVFGPKRLPEIGSAVGKTFNEFKKALSDLPPQEAAA